MRTYLQTVKIICTFITSVVFLNGCSSYLNALKEYNVQEFNTYPGAVYLKNGERRTGMVAAPNVESKSVLYIGGDSVKRAFDAKEIEKIELYNAAFPERMYVFRLMPVKSFSGSSNKWMVLLVASENLSAYIAAAGYRILSDGSLQLGGYSHSTRGGFSTSTTLPSFPIYFQKKGDKYPSFVGVRGGVVNEAPAFRAGVSRFLRDDPQLTEYMRNAKWSIDNVEDIVTAYTPNRSEANKLEFEGVAVEPQAYSLFTNDFTKEVIYYAETAYSLDKSGMQYGLGVRYIPYKFINLGANMGYASVVQVSSDKRLINHLPNNNINTAPVIPEDYTKGNGAYLDMHVGGQLPFDLKKVYLIPSANMSFGGLESGDYDTWYYGPMGMLDLGFKLNYDSSLLLGVGYRYIIPIKNATEKAEASYPGHDAYQSFGSAFFRLTYKW